MKTAAFYIICAVSFSMYAVGQDDMRKSSVRLSTLPAAEQSSVNSAIQHWYRQFESKAKDRSVNALGDASVATVRLGPAHENDLILTDRAGCSPTGNCSIFVMRPVKDRYRVVLEGIGQTFTVMRARANGFQNIEIRMHGSATMSAIKVYKFNGTRYLRSGCYDENFEVLDSAGNSRELKKPQITPCQ